GSGDQAPDPALQPGAAAPGAGTGLAGHGRPGLWRCRPLAGRALPAGSPGGLARALGAGDGSCRQAPLRLLDPLSLPALRPADPRPAAGPTGKPGVGLSHGAG